MSSPEIRPSQFVPTDNDSPWLREIASARIDATHLRVQLVDGCELTVPLTFFPTLELASDTDRQAMEVCPYSLSWEALDCDLGIEGLLQGLREDPRLAERARLRWQESQAHAAA